MKFGNSILNQIIPEWSSHYINYNKLKTILKFDCTNFHLALQEEIDRTQSFYIKKLNSLKETNDILKPTNKDELIKLFQFAQLNMQSIRKITKKYDKHNIPFKWTFEKGGIFDWQEDITLFDNENDLLKNVKPCSPLRELVVSGDCIAYEEFIFNGNINDPVALSGSLKLHSISIVQELSRMKSKSILELENEFSKSFLSTAVNGGFWFGERSKEFYSFLLEEGIKVEKCLLHLILENKNEYLLEKLFPFLEAQIDLLDEYGNLPLCYAVKAQTASLLEIFIKKSSKLDKFSFRITGDSCTSSAENDALVLCCRLYHKVDPDCIFLKSLLIDGNLSKHVLYALSLCVQHSWKKELRFLLIEKNYSLDYTDPNTGIDLLSLSANIGDIEVIEILLNSGANPTIIDESNWVPHEHAFLKGHLQAGMILKHSFNEINLTKPEIAYKRPISTAENGSPKSKDNIFQQQQQKQQPKRRPESIGMHGLLRIRIVDLFLKKLTHKKMTFSIEDNEITLDLPLLPNHRDSLYSLPLKEPIRKDCCSQKSSSSSILKIEIHSQTKRGMSSLFLETLNTPPDHIHHLPIVNDQYETIGNITLEILPILPLPFKHISIDHYLDAFVDHTNNPDDQNNKKSKLIGHRGSGSNRRAGTEKKASSIIRENTLLSFLTAINQGADYVEFDVQLTKDRHPIIYHDFTIHELKNVVEVPVHALSLSEFLNLSQLAHFNQEVCNQPHHHNQLHHHNQPHHRYPNQTQNYHVSSSISLLSNTTSNTTLSKNYHKTLLQKKHHTTIESLNLEEGRKPRREENDFIMAPGLSLREAFKGLPSGVGFNIEIKYPVIDEIVGHCFEVLRPLEINGFVDDIITVCLEEIDGCSYVVSNNCNNCNTSMSCKDYNNANVCNVPNDPNKINDPNNVNKISRPLMFSSFNPDICYLLSLKQRKIPVFFLTDGGMTKWTIEQRGNSIDSAVKFSIRANLAGIVCNSTPLIEAPSLIGHIKRSGLSLFTFGSQNNEIEGVKLQKANGVDAIIADNVGTIYNGLNV